MRVIYQNITHIYTLSVYADVSVCHYKPLSTARLTCRYHDITIINAAVRIIVKVEVTMLLGRWAHSTKTFTNNPPMTQDKNHPETTPQSDIPIPDKTNPPGEEEPKTHSSHYHHTKGLLLWPQRPKTPANLGCTKCSPPSSKVQTRYQE